MTQQKYGKRSEKGFTLLEMIVAVALFAVVMLVSVGALLSLVAASRKAQSLHLVVNNLNITLDAMVRSIRMGSNYNCNSTAIPGPSGGDCAGGADTISFTPFGGDPDAQEERWVYQYDPVTERMYRSEDGGQNFLAITAQTVTVDSMGFYVVGTEPADITQPKVVIVVKGTAGGQEIRTETSFSVQSTAVQRILDL